MAYAGKHEMDQVFGPPIPPEPPSGRRRRQIIKLLLVMAGALFAVGGISAAGLYLYFSRDLPPIEALREYQPSLVTRVYGEDKKLIGQYYIEQRVVVPIEQMPENLLKAVISVEDARFYKHHGIDPIGIARAFAANMFSFSIRQGASTITQQLARSLFLSSERKFSRKIKEAILALKMERMLSKDEILELYLNQIYFGHGTYGVQAAAKTYFGKDVEDLTLAEAAYLAGVPRAPTDYSPYNHPERAKQRQGVVLGRLVDEGHITREEMQEVFGEDLFFRKLQKKEQVAPYFMEYVRLYLSETYGDQMVYKGGLSVYTTLNLEMQKGANNAVREGLLDLDKRQGYRGPLRKKTGEEIAQDIEAGIPYTVYSEIKKGDRVEGLVTGVNDNGATVLVSGFTGQITPKGMAWAKKRVTGPDLMKDTLEDRQAKPQDILEVGDVVLVKVIQVDNEKKTARLLLDQEPLAEGALIALDPRTGAIRAMVGGYDFERSEFNRAVSARRQIGSTFKPFIYAAAIDRGYTPASIIVDAPIVYVDEETLKVWKPENYESRFYGPTTLRDGLTFSRNLATVRLLDEIGIKNALDFSRRLGIRGQLPRNLSLALGSASLSLLEVCSAYGVFANEGIRVEPVSVLSVVASDGTILEEHVPEGGEVISRETAYIATNLMEDVIQRGTGQRAKSLRRALAGKTGTTNDFTDAWFTGFTPNLVAGVWVGFDAVRSLGPKEAGSRSALPIWMSFMRDALELVPPMNFKIPENIVYARIDPENGLLAGEGSGEGVVEIFPQGNQPRETSHQLPRPAEFFRIDASES